MPTGERGVTFVNGQLSAMPGLQPDLGHILHDGDRVGFFDPKSMWPFQYRHGAAMIPEMAKAWQQKRTTDSTTPTRKAIVRRLEEKSTGACSELQFEAEDKALVSNE